MFTSRNIASLAVVLFSTTAVLADVPETGTEFFEKKIRPVLVEHCYRCHSADAQQSKKLRGGLLLDTRHGWVKGGDTGPVIVPGKAKDSLLMKALRHEDGLRMPPKGKLPAAILADFSRWIDMGAPDPRAGKADLSSGWTLVDGRKFWSFQPIKKPALPPVKDAAWPKTGIDRFILARLESQDLRPVQPADKRTLLRRAYFDLIGLPPTPEDMDAFLKDESPTAFATVVDRLLASPQYGERWGRYWLDVARYAEDQAHTFGVQPNTNAWRYRDWVVNSLNEDMPFDRFVRLQIAADLIEKDDEAALVKHLPALGFFGLGAQYYKNSDAAKVIADELDDRVDTLSRGFLGLTVSCARCHDHKFDPIPQLDYYSLAGIFQSSRLANVPLAGKEQVKHFQTQERRMKELGDLIKTSTRNETIRLAEQRAGDIGRYLTAAWRFQVRVMKEPAWTVGSQAKQDKLDAAVLGRFVDGMKKSSLAGLDALSKTPAAAEDKAVALAQAFQSKVETGLAQRGKKATDKEIADLLQKLFGEKGVFTPSEGDVNKNMSAQVKEKLTDMKAKLAKLQKETKPLPIAHSVVESTPGDMKIYMRGNPEKQGELAPRRFLRVMAGDEPPPFRKGSGRLELADSVAGKDNPLTARVIVNRLWQHHFGRGLVGTPSNFGKMGEAPTHPELLDYLAARLIESGWSLKKLHREIMLSSVYQLGTDMNAKNLAADPDSKLLWRMTRRRLDVEVSRHSMLAVAGKLDMTLGGPSLDLSNPGNVRRTIYARVSRHDLNYVLRLFDFPDANITSERRTETTVPQQQLYVLNSAFLIETARALAARVQKEVPEEKGRVDRLFQLVYGRPPTANEFRLSVDFLSGTDTAEERANNRLTRWERLAQVLLGSNEFLYID